MIKDMPLKSKFENLQGFLGKILHDIRKDVRQEHLKQDKGFVQKYFSKKFVDKVAAEELEKAYFSELVAEGNEDLGNWIISKWILKHAEIYEYFASELVKINPKFEEITILPMDKAKAIGAKAVDQFGAEDAYIFSFLNSVAFPDEIFTVLRDEAQKQAAVRSEPVKKEESISFEVLTERHQQEILKLTDRYEKRLQAVTKKYVQDIEGLKKQIGGLQKKLGELKCC